MNATLGQRLLALRTARGWTQEDLAARSGVSRSRLAVIEKDRQGPPQQITLTRLAAALGVPVTELRPAQSLPPAPVAESPLVLALRAELRAAQAEHRQDMARVQKEFRQDLHAAGRTWQYTVDTMRRALDQQEAQLAELQAENHELKVRLGLRLPSPAEAGLFAAPAPASVAPIGFGVRPPQGAEMRASPGGRYFSKLRKVA